MLRGVMGILLTSSNRRYCPSCGRPVDPGANVCVCGQKYTELAAAELSSNQTPPDERLASRFAQAPYVTYFLIGFNSLIFLLMILAGGSTHVDTLLSFGAMYRPLVTLGEYWRLVTPIFLHIGFMHLAFNMYALLLLGSVTERIYGSTRFFHLYLFSGIGGTLASARFSTAVSAGASGAIFGLAGITLVVGYRYRERIPANFKSAVGRGIVPFVLFNLLYGLSNKGIDSFAHIGGLLAGAALAFVVPPSRQNSSPELFSFGVVVPLMIILGAFFYPVREHFEMKNVEADFKRALSLERDKRYEDSIAAYHRAMKHRPDLPAIHNNLAVIYSRQQKFEDAEREARKAVELGEREALYHQTLGAVLWQRAKLEEAAAQYRRALELEPKNVELHQALGEIYEEQNKWSEALQEWARVKELNPQEPSVEKRLEALRRHLPTQNVPH